MRTFTVVVVGLALCSGVALAQSGTASLTGVVDSCSNLPLTDLSVIARDQSQSLPPVPRTLKGDDTFEFPPLPHGQYDLIVILTENVGPFLNGSSEPIISRKVKLEAGGSWNHFSICRLPKPRFKGISPRDPFSEGQVNYSEKPVEVMGNRTQLKKVKTHTERKCYVALWPITGDADSIVVEGCPERSVR